MSRCDLNFGGEDWATHCDFSAKDGPATEQNTSEPVLMKELKTSPLSTLGTTFSFEFVI